MSAKRTYSSTELLTRVQSLEAERKQLMAEIRATAIRERTRGKIVVGATVLKLAGVEDRAENQAAFAAIVAGQLRAEDLIVRAAEAIRRRSSAATDGPRV
jgi:hypothetical protein